MAETTQEYAARLMRELNDTKQLRGMRTLNQFLKEWANGPVQVGVLEKACAILDDHNDDPELFTHEKVAHRIVLVTLQAWIESGSTR